MSETNAGFDATEWQAQLGSAAAALQEFAQGPARRAAADVGASFDRAGQRIARALGRAATDGEGSFKRLAKVILEELAKFALDRIFNASGQKLPFFGARANGGAVNAGGAYWWVNAALKCSYRDRADKSRASNRLARCRCTSTSVGVAMRMDCSAIKGKSRRRSHVLSPMGDETFDRVP